MRYIPDCRAVRIRFRGIGSYDTLCCIPRHDGERRARLDCARSRPSRSGALQFAKNIEDGALCEAVERTAKGLVGANLAVASSSSVLPGRDRGGPWVPRYRGVSSWAPGYLVHGFAKSERENLRPRELAALRSLANEMLGLDDAKLEAMLANGTISEVDCDDQAV